MLKGKSTPVVVAYGGATNPAVGATGPRKILLLLEAFLKDALALLVSSIHSREGTLFRLLCIAVAVQCFWLLFDVRVTSQIPHKLPRKYIPPKSIQDPPLPVYLQPYQGPSKVYETWRTSFPCGPLMSEKDLLMRSPYPKRGMFYVPVKQVASKTLSGIQARMAQNIAHRQQPHNVGPNTTMCTVRVASIKAKRYRERSQDNSFLWSFVREPAARLVSQYYHQVISLEGWGMNNNKQLALPKNAMKQFQGFVERYSINNYGFYFKTLSTRSVVAPARADMHELYTSEILRDYNFLGVYERLEESLAVLQLLLGLETQDLLHVVTAHHEYEVYRDGCVKLYKGQMTMDMMEWFYQPELDDFFDADAMVYRAANASLDLTIAQLGPPKVEKAVKRFQYAQRLVQERCGPKVRFPCTADGKLQKENNDCLMYDLACGKACLDEASQALGADAQFKALPK